ncbi:MAG: hypothetical protein HC890_04870 [Chloroflexaceae bacterium]|nr:hypothetical protein [Chloroflexaceae bacterium]
MSYTTLSPDIQSAQVWASLQQAIANSSGFRRWQQERPASSNGLEEQVRRYLKETLATLAY